MFKRIFAFLLFSFSLVGGEGQIAKVNNIDIWYETFGQKENPALLLIMGGCCQGVIWHDSFCQRLANKGFYVIRYDHRDTGLSTCIDFEKNPYDLMDMTNDAIGLLEAIGSEKAHLFGVSLGGLIAECMAAYYPEKVYTITLIGSTPDIHPMNLSFAGFPAENNAILPPPTSEYLTWMNEWTKLSPQTDEDMLSQRLDGWNRLNGHKVPLNEAMNCEIHKKFLSRFRYPQGIINHVLMLRSESSEELVRKVPSQVKVPTIILQGSEDPIFPPGHGEALSRAIENSEYFLVEGMGHIPNDHFFDLYINLLEQQKSKIPLQ